MRLLPILALLLLPALAAQPQSPSQVPAAGPAQGQRDLKVERMEDDGAPAKSLRPPRSWAVVVGISQYPKLDPARQLRYTERDAQSIYTILISPEGGSFKAENVHVLTGAKATLAGLRREIGQWLPSVAQDGDRVLIYFAGHGFV